MSYHFQALQENSKLLSVFLVKDNVMNVIIIKKNLGGNYSLSFLNFPYETHHFNLDHFNTLIHKCKFVLIR